jgi:plastocyanin
MSAETLAPVTDDRRRLPRPRAIALGAMLVAAVAWAFAWGAHEHGSPVIASDLSMAVPDARYEIDASTGTLDLAGIEAAPGSVVEFLLVGSAGAPHAFVLTGALPGSEMDESRAANGDTVIRLRVPEAGSLSFICTIPGHEGLHGNLIVGAPSSSTDR